MKTKHLLLVLGLITFFYSCNKNDDNTNDEKEKVELKYRIKQILINTNADDVNDKKTVFTYNEDKLVNYTDYKLESSGDWNDTEKTKITYTNDRATATQYRNQAAIWALTNKSVYTIQNGLIMEETYFYDNHGTLEPYWKYTYQYTGTSLSAWHSYYDISGTGNQDFKAKYIYTNKQLTESKEYELDYNDEWFEAIKNTFSYQDNALIKVLNYNLDANNEWQNNRKIILNYVEDNVSQMECLDWNSNSNLWESSYLCTYKYDANNYLTEVLDSYGHKTTYEYEEGTGNAKLFWYYPETLVEGEPTLQKGTSIKTKKHVPYYQRIQNW